MLAQLIANLLEVMEPVMAELDDMVDELEEEMIAEPRIQLRHRLSDLRREALQLRRYISPQREAIGKLRNLNLDWLSRDDLMSIQESYDRITRYVEMLDSIRERCQIVQDELATTMADKLNRNTYVLSIIAAIFLPLGFLTGLFGINIGGMPGVENNDAFNIMVYACVAIVAVELWLFKKLKWF